MSPTARALLGLVISAVTAGACGSGTPTVSPTPTPPDASQPLDRAAFIEALFFGTGPLADYSNRGCATQDQRMVGWPEGSVVTITISPTLSAEERAGVIGPASQAREATGGAVTTTVESATGSDPPQPTGEIAVVKVPPDQVQMLCGSQEADLCAAVVQSFGVIRSARIIGPDVAGGDGGGYSHELGHALFGLCHLNPASAVFQNPYGRSPASIMGAGNGGRRLTDDDMRAIKAVYAAGLRAGASRTEFINAGLIGR